MHGDTTRGDCNELQEYCRTIGRGRFWGPLLLSTKNRNDITDQYYWSAQPDVPSAVRGALVVFFSVCKTPFLLAPAEGWGPGLRPPVGFQCPNLELKTLNLRNFDCNFALFGGKIWLWLFYNLFCVMVLRFYTKNFKSFPPKMKAWRWFLRFKIKSVVRRKWAILTIIWDFLCRILEPLRKKNYKIAIVKFCLYIVPNCNQSHANFQFFKV